MPLPKKNHLNKSKDINQVFKNGRTVRGNFLFIRFLDNQKSYSRFTFLISAKYVPLAVDRNKIKRMLSGEIARAPSLLEQGLDIIVIVSKKVTREEFGRLVGELKELLL